jgi:hypothetical protein
MATNELNLTGEPDATPTGTGAGGPSPIILEPFNPDKDREQTRGDLARGLLWLLTFAVGGVLAFIAMGRLEGSVLSQSIFPSIIALAGTALGFYFGSQTNQPIGGARPSSPSQPAGPPVQPAPPVQPVQPVPAEQPVQPVPAEQPVQPAPAEQPVQPAPVEQPVQPAPAEPESSGDTNKPD